MAELARCYDGELGVYEYAAFLNGRLIFSEPEVVGDRPAHGSVFTLEGSAIVSAVKAEEDPEKPGIIVRLFCGMHEGDATAKLVFAEPVHRACICDLRERETEELAVDGATVELPVLEHCKFITVYVE